MCFHGTEDSPAYLSYFSGLLCFSMLRNIFKLLEKSTQSISKDPTACCSVQSVQLLSHVWLFATPWTVARQAFLSFTISQSLLKLKSIESVMPTIPSSVIPFSSCLQSFPASRSFLMSQLFASGGQKYWNFRTVQKHKPKMVVDPQTHHIHPYCISSPSSFLLV